jgi:hypothetical protein
MIFYFFFLFLDFGEGIFFRSLSFLYFFITLAILLLDITTPEKGWWGREGRNYPLT